MISESAASKVIVLSMTGQDPSSHFLPQYLWEAGVACREGLTVFLAVFSVKLLSQVAASIPLSSQEIVEMRMRGSFWDSSPTGPLHSAMTAFPSFRSLNNLQILNPIYLPPSRNIANTTFLAQLQCITAKYLHFKSTGECLGHFFSLANIRSNKPPIPLAFNEVFWYSSRRHYTAKTDRHVSWLPLSTTN